MLLTSRYLILTCAIATIWFLASIFLTLHLAAAEDDLDLNATVPWPLKAICAIAFFPTRYLQNWDRADGNVNISDVFLGFAINGLLWGVLLSSSHYYFIRRRTECKK